MRSAGWCAYMQSELEREEREQEYMHKRIAWEIEHESSETCPLCGSSMYILEGQYGKFLGCSTYPLCNGKKKYKPEQEQNQITGDFNKSAFQNNPTQNTISENCPMCGNKMYLREGKFGKFWGCSKYPACKGTKKIK